MHKLLQKELKIGQIALQTDIRSAKFEYVSKRNFVCYNSDIMSQAFPNLVLIEQYVTDITNLKNNVSHAVSCRNKKNMG